MTNVRKATPEDIQTLYNLTSMENHVKDNDYFERCLSEMTQGKREVFVVSSEDKLAGYCFYQRFPRYQPFRSLSIPEIQDVYIHPHHRQNGLATALIRYCEEQAMAEERDLIGLGVALTSSYGKAQKLYVKLGYEPDGAGAVYEREAVREGALYKMDDELCLMLVKRLK